jgi:hypothetical protein
MQKDTDFPVIFRIELSCSEWGKISIPGYFCCLLLGFRAFEMAFWRERLYPIFNIAPIEGGSTQSSSEPCSMGLNRIIRLANLAKQSCFARAICGMISRV